MTFEEYQKISRETAIYPKKDDDYIYPTLGLLGETGEVANKIQKVLRDKNGIIDEETRKAISEELGDVLWYFAQLVTELKLQMDEIALSNIEKLQSRKDRDTLSGTGDNR